MKTKINLYHFLDPKFGFEIVKHYFSHRLHDKVKITLVFSSLGFLPKRNLFNPIRLIDYFSNRKKKNLILQKYTIFNLDIIFTDDINQDNFTKSIPKNAIGICTGFNQIFSGSSIDQFKSLFNLHPSLLPYYRGPTPILWCQYYNEKSSGWTIHRIVEEIDSGEILFQKIISIKNKRRFEILDIIGSESKTVMFDLINSVIFDKEFNKMKLDASDIYKHHINYRSYFKKPVNSVKEF